MLSKQIFELFQVLIVMAAFPKLCSAILFPRRAKLLPLIPLPARVLPYFLRFERSSRSRSIPVNVQHRKPRSSPRLIQCPGNFVFGRGFRWATVRQDEHRRGPGSESRPENVNDKVVLARIQDVLAILRFRPGVLTFREVGTQQQPVFSVVAGGLRGSFILLFRSSQPVGVGDAYRNV